MTGFLVLHSKYTPTMEFMVAVDMIEEVGQAANGDAVIFMLSPPTGEAVCYTVVETYVDIKGLLIGLGHQVVGV